jgi:superfamily II DNA or RNA helicase
MLKIQRQDYWKFKYQGNEEEVAFLEQCLTLKNPNAFFIGRQTEYEIDSDVKLFRPAEKTFGHGLISFFLDEAKKLRKKSGKKIEVEITDFDYKEANIKCHDFLRYYQVNAVKAIFKFKFGIIKIPTRGGKTVVAAEFFRQVLMQDCTARIIMFVDTVDLFNQTVKELKNFLNCQIGEIRNGKMDLSCNITVAMVQTAAKILTIAYKDKVKHRTLKKFVENVDVLVIDEIHEYMSDKRRAMIKKFKNVEYFVSLSATPFKANAQINNLKLMALTGPIIYEVKEQELIESGFITESKIFLVLFDHGKQRIDKDIENRFHGFRDKLVFMNDKRDFILIMLTQLLEKEGFKILVLFSSVVHGKRIELEGGWKFISGETETNDRSDEKDKFLSAKGGSVLLASNIFKKGITLPEVQILINADGGLEDSAIVQKRGRVIGTSEGKTRSAIIDIMDLFSQYLSEHSTNRLSVYEETNGKDNIMGFDVKDKAWLNNIVLEVKNWLNGR